MTHVENGGLVLALNPDRPAARLVWEGTNLNRTDRPPQRSLISTAAVTGDAVYGLKASSAASICETAPHSGRPKG